jgi:hypothetical protein
MRQYNDDIANYIEKVIIPYVLALIIKIAYAKKRAQAINNYKRKTDNRSLNSPPVSCINNLTLDLDDVNYNYSFKDYYNYIIKLFNIKNINYKLVKVITYNLLRKKFKLKILKYKPLIIESI